MSAVSSQALGGAHPTSATPKAKRKHTGQSKRTAQKRVGSRADWQPIDAATPAKSAVAQAANARSVIAAGRQKRVDAETNVQAFAAIKVVFGKHSSALAARGLPAVALHGAELNCERLAVLLEVESMSAPSFAVALALGDMAFVMKRREAIHRLLPGPDNAGERRKFGLHQPVRADQPATLQEAAQMLARGKKASPKSRAARLLTAEDEKRCKAIVKSIATTTAEQRKARAEGTSRTTERDILNTALELFYDEFAACIGLVLEDDELARLQALELVPRRPEQRRAAGDEPGANDGATGAAGQGASAAGGTAAAPVVALATTT